MLNTRHTFQQTCLRYRLEHQSQEIEAVLRRYTSLQTAVTDGEVLSTAIHYHVSLSTPLPHRTCQAALTQALKTPVTLTAVPTGCIVTVPRPQPPVSLLDLLLTYAPQTAVLGLDATGQPVPFTWHPNTHVLIAGQPGSGKTTLLHTLVVTQALAQPTRFLLIQGKGSRELHALNQLPPAYRLGQVVTEVAQVSGVLAGLRSSRLPTVVVIDDVEQLLAVGKTAVLLPLLQLLHQPSVHLVVTTARPESDLLVCLADAFAVRLVGKTADAAQSQVATGWPNSLAEQLLGQGDFLASTLKGSFPGYFQVAYADAYDTGFLLGQLPVARQLAGWENGRMAACVTPVA